MALFDFMKPKWKRSNPKTRIAGLSELEDHWVLAELTESDPDESVRTAAFDRLETVWKETAMKCVGDDDHEKRQFCAERLTNHLECDNTCVRLVTAKLLGRLGIKATAYPMQVLATLSVVDSEQSVKEAAGDAIVKILISVVNDSDQVSAFEADQTKRFVVEAIQKMNVKDPRIVDPLIKIVSEEDSYILCDAIIALGNQRDKLGVEPLKQIIKKSDDCNLRPDIKAANALVKIGDPEAIQFAVARGLIYGDEEVDRLIEKTVDAWVMDDLDKFNTSFIKIREIQDEKKVVNLLKMRFEPFSVDIIIPEDAKSNDLFDAIENDLREHRGYSWKNQDNQ
jgi:hypothetical protein